MCRRYSRYISCVDRWSSVGLVIHVVSFTRAYTIIHYTVPIIILLHNVTCYMLPLLYILYIYIYIPSMHLPGIFYITIFIFDSLLQLELLLFLLFPSLFHTTTTTTAATIAITNTTLHFRVPFPCTCRGIGDVDARFCFHLHRTTYE
jgi:hypothetical protein